MYRDASDEVVRLGEDVRRRDRLQRHAAAAQIEADRLDAELKELERGLSKEERDVEKLEGTSLTRLLLSALGKMEERLDKERREALEARLRVEAKKAELESTREEVDRLQRELSALDGIDAKYERAFLDKLGRIRHDGGETAERMEALIAEVSQTARLVQEIDEASQAGEWVLRHLTEAVRNIETLEEETAAAIAAMNTAIVFTMTMSSAMPTAHRLEHNLRAAHQWIGRFAREVSDIPGWAQHGAEIASHANLLIPFINIVAGGRQVEAERSKAAVREAARQVGRLQRALHATRPSAVAQWEDAMRRYREAVARA